ncbi:MAG TPA: hypothetical protein VGM54_08920 [Chthoniobacter sp.]|jgi:hypothetical protein
MSLAEIKSAVRELSPKELAELAAFVAREDNTAWAAQIEGDAAGGKLDFLFDEAESERAAGTLREWPEK